MRNFQGIIFTQTQTCRKIFKSALVYLSKCTCKGYRNEKVFGVSMKLVNNTGCFICSIQDQWEYMYCCEEFQGFDYLDLKTPFKTKNVKK